MDKRIKTTNPSKLTQFAPRIYGGLFLCLILIYLSPVKGISHTKSIKRLCLLNQQSDVEFVCTQSSRSVQSLWSARSAFLGNRFLCLILVYLGPVKEISHRKSIKTVCLLNQQCAACG